jgi:DNA-binding transcriptional LysR family regulator
LEVVAAGNMSVAADRLHITHSTVTVRIKSLEEILQRQLLNRNRSGITLTADGVRFHEFAESLVRTWQIARRHMSLASGFQSILSIGVDRILWSDLMNDWLVKTRRAKPEIALRCEAGSSEYLLQRLFQGWIDVCIVYEHQTRSGFRAEKLFDDPLILASTSRREAQKAMDPMFVEIDYDKNARYQEAVIWGENEDTPHVSVTDLDMGLEIIANFGGSVLVPKRLMSRTDLPFQLHPIPDQPVIERTVYMVYSPDALKPRHRRLTAPQLKESLQRKFKGEDVIWD